VHTGLEGEEQVALEFDGGRAAQVGSMRSSVGKVKMMKTEND
jgi:hypothetical protein